MIINSKQSKPRKTIDLLFTFFGWLFLILFLYNFSSHFDRDLDFTFLELNLDNANSILLITFLVVITSAVALSWWSSYNKRKFGPLKRRTFPPQTNEKDLAEYFQLTEVELEIIKKDSYIERT
ncbi:poly-beta-1,6-N-acetyl-D-glucosamine biosynthesis protein PgaD [Bacillus sp. ISL-35]|uniref:poly-beta-1,6-N-acetyl-D-glucosamine biosynthesis protein PgaD n=1 Tax=Bacillus sp. ISL-35 TaxID=2819122 RepID=UPI001BEAB4DA|nr:poly-beta-1,6-N-acetyl-D-glucosamine biosynthesis protein PgaD [Bacillus sp. ISL-35]MBT2678785.1 poly-beta-1,6-N-acetyl-D-glucosamine biosynthesis protein PgaD [Bacillus sp. ISL-35]MBT2703777.1 poly-beta-1,6-N-acetyl-D-glucosamine biosynthesis protein PgaD [Chryseobacterium sp. ISL-80]